MGRISGTKLNFRRTRLESRNWRFKFEALYR